MFIILTAVFLFTASSTGSGETPHQPGTPTPSEVWFTQIGAWHLVHDSLLARSHLYHNAAIDGLQSGQARADLKLNRQIANLTRLEATLSVGHGSTAGILLNGGSLTYCILLHRGSPGDSLHIVKHAAKQLFRIATIVTTLSDTSRLVVTVMSDSLRVTIGKTSYTIKRPADLPAETTIGLTCSMGEVRVWNLRAEAPSEHLDESFEHATIINLGMEKMFKLRTTHPAR